MFDAIYQLFWLNPWAQTVGIVALIFGASAFYNRDDQKLRRYLTVFTLLMSLHFLMLDLWVAAATAFLGSIRTYISSRTKNIWVMFGFLITLLAISVPNISEPVHTLPLLATFFGTWGLFREQGIRMRILMLLGTICWFSHNFIVGSIGGAIIEGSFLAINARTMIKMMRSDLIFLVTLVL